MHEKFLTVEDDRRSKSKSRAKVLGQVERLFPAGRAPVFSRHSNFETVTPTGCKDSAFAVPSRMLIPKFGRHSLVWTQPISRRSTVC